MPAATRPAAWRFLFVASALLIIPGTLLHPRVPGMATMLAHPDWTPSHLLLLAGYGALLAALLAYRRAEVATAKRWLNLAVAGAALQVVEAAFHLAAVVDLDRLHAGAATPVLSIHLALTALFYPLFSLSMIYLIASGARERSLGSWWIAPLGVLGVAMHGAAAILVVVLGQGGLGVLFAGIALFGVWMLLAALWPVRRPAVEARGTSAASLHPEAPVRA